MSGDGRLVVVSDDAHSAERIARPLRDRGWQVDTQSGDPATACHAIGQCPPGAVVISLDINGAEPGKCDLACALSVAEVIHDVPIVFVGGTSDAQALARECAPSALFVDSAELPWAIKRLAFKH